MVLAGRPGTEVHLGTGGPETGSGVCQAGGALHQLSSFRAGCQDGLGSPRAEKNGNKRSWELAAA